MRISDWSSDVCSSDLQVGPRCPEAARLGKAGRQDAGALAAMLDDRFQHPPGAAQAVAERLGRARLPARHIVDMVLQVGAHPGAVEGDVDTMFGQVRRRPDPRQHQYLRRSEEHTSELQSLMRISYA